MSETFEASTQYNDYFGSSAADDDDDNFTAKHWLIERKLISDDELVVGIKVLIGDLHNLDKNPKCSVTFLIYPITRTDSLERYLSENRTVKFKEVEEDMTIIEFMSLFKRISFAFSLNGLLQGKDVKQF